ncbi:hypothetical protein [Alteromonas facilis]|uniref:hypothetical protein n=1 Tax=Alteromonas facilis TaxID=2048004 RepID=UPI001F0C1890|nr:hypothetical protein [Alteromonas facilis]
MREQRAKEKALKKAKAEEAAAESSENTSETKADVVTQSFANTKNILWVILAAGMAITVIGSQFMPGIVAHGSMTSVYSAMLWVGIFGAALARYLNKSGWMGFAVGSGCGVLLNILASIL